MTAKSRELLWYAADQINSRSILGLCRPKCPRPSLSELASEVMDEVFSQDRMKALFEEADFFYKMLTKDNDQV